MSDTVIPISRPDVRKHCSRSYSEEASRAWTGTDPRKTQARKNTRDLSRVWTWKHNECSAEGPAPPDTLHASVQDDVWNLLNMVVISWNRDPSTFLIEGSGDAKPVWKPKEESRFLL
ncbi:uncharacterized protein LOC111871890 [Cryptotermes secundus]|uniref:uncharacterized protein LOC111871890 n=1 Tax=Cryptotermes secundus TaxID=105785 RepID=UPI000CD7CB9F|nr:uncharacterized protein LOC111871890 [Cryptotermes secundus]